MKTPRIAAFAAAAAAALAVVGCGSDDTTGTPDPGATEPAEATTTQATPPAPAPADGMTTAGFTAALADLKDELGYSPEVLEVSITEFETTFEVRDRAKPDNVDSYSWKDGAVDGPTPVQLLGGGSLAENVFPLANLKPAAVDRLVAAAAALKLEGGKIGAITAKRNLPFTTRVQWTVAVSGSRASKAIQADLTGKVLRVV